MSKKTSLEDRLGVLEQWVKKLSQELDELRKGLTVATANPVSTPGEQLRPEWPMLDDVKATWDDFVRNPVEDIEEGDRLHVVDTATASLNTLWAVWQNRAHDESHVLIKSAELPELPRFIPEWNISQLVRWFLPNLRLGYANTEETGTIGGWYILFSTTTPVTIRKNSSTKSNRK